MQQKLSERFAHQLYTFAGPRSMSLVAALIILGFLSFGTTVNEISNSQKEFTTWAGIAYQSFAVAFLYFNIVRFLILKFLPNINMARAIAIAILFFSTEMVRAIFVGLMGVQLELTDTVNWGYRIVAGGGTGLAIFGITAVVLNDNQRYRESLAELQNAKEQLSQAAAVTEDNILSIRKQILGTIRSAINNSLSSVMQQAKQTEADSKFVVDELVRVSDDVVRPLSHKLFADSFSTVDLVETKTKTKVSSKRVLQVLNVSDPFKPGPTVSLILLLFIGGSIFDTTNPVLGLLALILLLGWLAISLSIARKLIQPFLVKLPVWINIFVISGIFSFIAFLASQFDFIPTVYKLNVNATSIFYFSFLVATLSWLLAIYRGIQIARSEVLASAEETNTDLVWATARLGAQLSAEKQRLAAVVHRDIQGRLISSALKFQQEIASGKDIAMASDELESIVGTITNLVNEPQAVTKPVELVAQLNEVWNSVFEINLVTSTETKSRVDQDLICCQSISDIIGEFVTNSVKHGKASHGDIELELMAPTILKMTMKNNGKPMPENVQPGLGTQLINQQALSLVSENLPGKGVSFTMTLPLA